MKKLEKTFYTIYSAFGLGIQIIDCNFKDLFSISAVERPEWMDEYFHSTYQDIYEQSIIRKPNEFCYYQDKYFNLSWITTGIWDGSPLPRVLFAGPFIMENISTEFISTILTKTNLPLLYRSDLERFYQQVPKLEIPLFTLGEIFISLLKHPVEDVTIATTHESLETSSEEMSVTKHQIKNNNKKIMTQYTIEKQYRHAVSQGNKKLALEILNKFPMNFDYRMPKNALRLKKNLNLVVNTMLRIAAHDGGCDSITVHRISEHFSKLIELTNNIVGQYEMQSQMTIEYCDAVKKAQLGNHSSLVKDIIQYIQLYFEDDIGLQSISDEMKYTPSYIAKRFREEMNMSVVDYINLVRVNEAKLLLKSPTISITEIGFMIGYNSYSYFSSVFKKMTGMTCREYRNQEKERLP